MLILLLFLPPASAQDTVKVGEDVAGYLNSNKVDLVLEGDANWNAQVYVNNSSRAALSIDGQGHTIYMITNHTSALRNFSQNNTISIRNVTFTPKNPYSAQIDYLIGFESQNVTSHLDLEGTTFTGFNRADNRGGAIVFAYGSGSDITIDGGRQGVTFSKNRAEWDAGGAMAISYATLAYKGKVTFDSNWSGNYGGAVEVYDYLNSLNFDGATLFTGNHAMVFGGAIDVWGGQATVAFNGETTFDGNYIHYTYSGGNTFEEPRHVNDQHPRGGAINIGYIGSSGNGASVTFNAPVTFANNFVVSTGSNNNNKNAMGGAVSVYGNNTPQDYRLRFNSAASFENNYAYSVNGSGRGGAIFYDSRAAEITFSSDTRFTDNYASDLGGAIYLQSGTLNMNATAGDIVFQGNRHGVTFTPKSSGVGYDADASSGTPNAIYLGASGYLNLNATAGNTIAFHDPIASVAGSTVTVTKMGDGEVIFHGDGGVNSQYDSNIQANTTVQGGYFTLSDGVGYGNTASGAFGVQSGGTVRGNANATLRARTLTVESGGALGANGGAFTVDSPSVSLKNGARLIGFGTLASASDFVIGYEVAADVDSGRTLAVDARLTGVGGGLTKTGAGALVLGAANTYTGATLVQNGLLGAGTANAFAQSGSVMINADAGLRLNDFDQIANNLAGAGTVDLGTAQLTVNNTSATAFSGAVTGGGKVLKTGAGALRLSGESDYSGGTAISTGRIIATKGTALGGGAVTGSAGTTLELEVAGDETMANRLTVAALEKTGAGTARLGGAGSGATTVTVKAGALSFEQTGVFSADAYTTNGGATTAVGPNATLVVADTFTQESASTLGVTIGANNEPAITAVSVRIGGNLVVDGINGTMAGKASELDDNRFTVISSGTVIQGDFDKVSLGALDSPVDYVTATGGISANQLQYNVGMGLTWLAGQAKGDGVFTPANAGDAFEVDIVLRDQTTTPFASGWTGKDLTKKGLGTLTLSEQNLYTGKTSVQAGALSLTGTNAIAASTSVAVSSGATLALNGKSQLTQNLEGAGVVDLAGSVLTVQNGSDTVFSGVLRNGGALIKTGIGELRLAGANSHAATTVSGGRLAVTRAAALGSGAAQVGSGGVLELAFAGDERVANTVTVTGALEKTGAGTARLDNVGSATGTVTVKGGALSLEHTGAFVIGTYTTKAGAATSLDNTARLDVAGVFTQEAGAELGVAVGAANEPAVEADSANIGGVLRITGFGGGTLARYGAFAGDRFTVISTDNGITGTFSEVDLGSAASPVDYLVVSGAFENNNKDFTIGLGLRWLAGPDEGDGVFTLVNAADSFEVDTVLANRTGPFASQWTGRDLTKRGAGALILAGQNTYTGFTSVEAGTLSATVANAFATSSSVTVASGATLKLNGTAQTAQNLSGKGTVYLDGATLTLQNGSATEFAGNIVDGGSLIKTGNGDLRLSGGNTHGATTVSEGRLVAARAASLGTGAIGIAGGAVLELDFSAAGTVANTITGAGALEKTGAGTAILTATGSNLNTVDVQEGILSLRQAGSLAAGTYTTRGGAETRLGAGSQLVVEGVFTQADNSRLDIDIGGASPSIQADSAKIGGSLVVTGVTGHVFSKASDLDASRHAVIATAQGITGDFSSVSISGSIGSVDYLAITGSFSDDRKSYTVGTGLSWLAGAAKGHGTFTLADAADTFEVDVVLADQTGVFASRWNGTDLTKRGPGTLALSRVNSYSGKTRVEEGTLSATIADAFATSSSVTVNQGAQLLLNDKNQTARNLSGAGRIETGSAILTLDNTAASTFSGAIAGSGTVVKTGNGALRLSGDNSHGATMVSAGRLIASQGASLGNGKATVASGAALELNFVGDGTVDNALAVSGTLEKTGSGISTLTASGSNGGTTKVLAGTLSLQQNGVFTAGGYSTASGAATVIGQNSKLTAAIFEQQSGSTLGVAVGAANEPAVSATRATITGSALDISGFTDPAMTRSSTAERQSFTVISTTDGITGNFAAVNLGGAASGVDYLTVAGSKSGDGLTYSIAFGLRWFAGREEGDGVFTLAGANDVFTVDAVLTNQTGPFASNWNGSDLAKKGLGILILDAVNAYTGKTLIEAGTLAATKANAFAQSAAVTVNAGAALVLNGNAQTAKNLSGAGEVELGGATLTLDNNASSSFSGDITGSGKVIKTGDGALRLSGDSDYDGGTTVSAGRLVAASGTALGRGAVTGAAGTALELAMADDQTLANRLALSGALEKTGAGIARLAGAGSSVTAVNVIDGTLSLQQNGAFQAGAYATQKGAATSLGAGSTLDVGATFTQSGGSVLNVVLGSPDTPNITASKAVIGGTLNVSGLNTRSMRSASDLETRLYRIIATNDFIVGDFSAVNLDAAGPAVDYLTLLGQKSGNEAEYLVGVQLTWYAGPERADGVFTLEDESDYFEVDLGLVDRQFSTRTGTGWNGTDLTKRGQGTLVLSNQNTYTGRTVVEAGTLRTGTPNAFLRSASMTVNAGATLDLDGNYQTVRNLSGAGTIDLGGAYMLAANSVASDFSGAITGSGRLDVFGTAQLTLSGVNTHAGGTRVMDGGDLVATNSHALGAGDVHIFPTGTLRLDLADGAAMGNKFSGSGTLIKTGSGAVSLIADGSSAGTVNVIRGGLSLDQAGVFTAGSYATQSGATTAIGSLSKLDVDASFTQKAGATLDVAIGASNEPAISAGSASIAGTLNVTGFQDHTLTRASDFVGRTFDVIQTTSGISGAFTAVNVGTDDNSYDFLTVTGGFNAQNTVYSVGFGLRWNAAPDQGDGVFTLPGQSDVFDVNRVLANRDGTFDSGWNGRDLTKRGQGTLILSEKNTYTGKTRIEEGTLLGGATDAFAASTEVIVDEDGILNLNHFAQTAQNLSGAGCVVLAGADLTAINSKTTEFSGHIGGDGGLTKKGDGTLRLSGDNIYSGGTDIAVGRLVAASGTALGAAGATIGAGATLELNASSSAARASADMTLANRLTGPGTVEKTGDGIVRLTNADSAVGAVDTRAGTLSFEQLGVFTAAGYTARNGAATAIGGDSQLDAGALFTQEGGATLNVEVGQHNAPAVTASHAAIAGTLDITGFSDGFTAKSSRLHGRSYVVIDTTGGIDGDFDRVNIGGFHSDVDYLVVAGYVSTDTLQYLVDFGLTWYAAPQYAHGAFTIADGQAFDLDTVLANRDDGPFASGWSGTDLAKKGGGALILSVRNTYDGETLVEEGTLAMGTVDAIADSSAVTVEEGARIDLVAFDQAFNNLSGAGTVDLGTAVLTAANDKDTEFSGMIEGGGRVIKTGDNVLKLSGDNTYAGDTAIAGGVLAATNGSALGTGAVDLRAGGTLRLEVEGDETFANVISGSGVLEKTGNGAARLTAAASAGAVSARQGELSFEQPGMFTANAYTTSAGAAASLGLRSTLEVTTALTQQAGSTLNVNVSALMKDDAAIHARDASIDGALNIIGFDPTLPASVLTATRHIVIQADHAIAGDFAVDFGGILTGVDYLLLDGANESDKYTVGFAMTWLADESLGDGKFTMPDARNTFEVDIELNDRYGDFASGWNGRDLIKDGAGTLILSESNGYGGVTHIKGGILSAKHVDVFAESSDIVVEAGATLALNGHNQVAHNLSGAGALNLGDGALNLGDGAAELTVVSDGDTEFSGVIGGQGSIVKRGDADLRLSGNNTYAGPTTVAAGRLTATNGSALGAGPVSVDEHSALEFGFAENDRFTNTVTGKGDIVKSGAGQMLVDQALANVRGPVLIAGGALVVGDASMTGSVLGGSSVRVAAAGALSGTGSVAGGVTNEGTIAALNALPGYEDAAAAGFATGALINSGTILLAGGQIGNTLTVRGGLTGGNGLLVLGTSLGDDNSPTDRLILDGGITSGVTGVEVRNRGGLGAFTDVGILVIDAVNGATTTGDAFFLTSTSPGVRRGLGRLAAGAFDYELLRGGNGGAENSWYLVSAGGGPRPEAGTYLANRHAAEGMFFHGMRDRLAGYETRLDPETGSRILGSAWGRIRVNRDKMSTAHGRHSTRTTTYLLHTGVDVLGQQGGTWGDLRLGVMGGLGTARGKTRYAAEPGLWSKGNFDGYALGVYATWFLDADRKEGLYLDSWLQHAWFRNKTRGRGLATERYAAAMWSGSVEAGYAFTLAATPSAAWSVIPAVQLAYGDYSADTFTEAGGTRVRNLDTGYWTFRAGARVQANVNRDTRHAIEPYVEANWLWRDRTGRLGMDQSIIVTDAPKNTGELKIGVDAELRKNLRLGIGLYGQLGENKFRNYGGQIGLRFEW